MVSVHCWGHIRIIKMQGSKSAKRQSKPPFSNLCPVLVSKHCVRASFRVHMRQAKSSKQRNTGCGGKTASCVQPCSPICHRIPSSRWSFSSRNLRLSHSRPPPRGSRRDLCPVPTDALSPTPGGGSGVPSSASSAAAPSAALLPPYLFFFSTVGPPRYESTTIDTRKSATMPANIMKRSNTVTILSCCISLSFSQIREREECLKKPHPALPPSSPHPSATSERCTPHQHAGSWRGFRPSAATPLPTPDKPEPHRRPKVVALRGQNFALRQH